MTSYTHNVRQPNWTAETGADCNALQVESGTQPSPPKSHQTEQDSRSVMHPDHHDPDWRYYFGAMAG